MKMIEVKNLTFSYGKDKQALHGLNFSVADGEIFGFLGPNGSGKSTTQKILTGILKGHGGEVSLFGKDLRTVQTQEFFQQIGVLFEFPYLYANLSAVDNLNYFASFYPKEQLRDVKELLEELEFKKDFLNKPVSSYSKGMRQRVSMARALITSCSETGTLCRFPAGRNRGWPSHLPLHQSGLFSSLTNPPAALIPPALSFLEKSSRKNGKKAQRYFSQHTICWTLTYSVTV